MAFTNKGIYMDDVLEKVHFYTDQFHTPEKQENENYYIDENVSRGTFDVVAEHTSGGKYFGDDENIILQEQQEKLPVVSSFDYIIFVGLIFAVILLIISKIRGRKE